MQIIQLYILYRKRKVTQRKLLILSNINRRSFPSSLFVDEVLWA